MLIYRIEGKDGVGPYQYGWGRSKRQVKLARDITESHSGDRSHPTPNSDGCGYMSELDYCGFKSLFDLQLWFYGWEHDLKKAKYRVMVYEVDPEEVTFGRHQVIFMKSEATPIKKMKIKEAFAI